MLGILVIVGIALSSGFGLIDYETNYSRITKTYSTNANKEMMPVTIVMLVLAIIAFIFALVYLVVVGTLFKRPTSTINYSQNNSAYPVNLSMNNTAYPVNLAMNNNLNNSAWMYEQNMPYNPVNSVQNHSFDPNYSANWMWKKIILSEISKKFQKSIKS